MAKSPVSRRNTPMQPIALQPIEPIGLEWRLSIYGPSIQGESLERFRPQSQIYFRSRAQRGRVADSGTPFHRLIFYLIKTPQNFLRNGAIEKTEIINRKQRYMLEEATKTAEELPPIDQVKEAEAKTVKGPLDGMLYKGNTFPPDYYLIEASLKRRMDSTTANNLYSAFDLANAPVLPLLPVFLDGLPISNDALLVQSSGQYFLVEYHCKRLITAEAIAQKPGKYNFDDTKAIVIPPVILDCVPRGLEIRPWPFP